MKRVLFAAASAVVLCATSGAALAQSKTASAAGSASASRFGAWGYDAAGRNSAVKAGDSFYDHANGTWHEREQFDADLPSAGVSVDKFKLVEQQLRTLVDESVRAPKTPSAQKVGDLYKSFMDEARLEALGDKPLQADLAAVKAVKDKSGMAELMGAAAYGFGTALLTGGVTIDVKNPTQYVASSGIGGMGLPDRDYYLTDRFKPQKAAYEAFIARTLQMVDWPNAQASAKAVVDFETRVAEATWTRTERRDPNKTYNPMTLSELKALTPGYDWDAYLRGAQLPGVERIIVGQNTAYPKVAGIYNETALDTLKAWQAFHTTRQASPYLSKRFVDSNFEFSKALSGTQQLRDRDKRGVALVNGTLGEVLGQEYVARHFPPSHKAQMEAMVANLHKAMRARIEGADWMSPSTRAEALKKLDRQRVKIGYPDKWRDYTALRIDPADLYGNIERASAFNAAFERARLGRPVDREEWFMTPQTINAYFAPPLNEIVFPAAYLQPPSFDPKADPAVNYGAVGSVIGHEITHGFDDQGRQFDADGVLRDWWAPADAARFTAEATKLAVQYDEYEPLPGAKINGKLTLGENIADQGGALLALDGYHLSLGGKPAPVIDGLTGEQRFFLGYAQNRRSKVRDDTLRMTLASDPHAPGRYRVDGVLRNLDEWYAAFDVKAGEKLYLAPEARAKVW